jgi:membrane associated rhomboid family serine protease
MVPLSDASRRPVHFPAMTLAIITAKLLNFHLELVHGGAFVRQWAFIPAHISPQRDLFTVLTVMFLRAGWLYVIGHMLLIGIWLILQLVSQLSLSGAGVAFMARIGVFIFGAAAAPFPAVIAEQAGSCSVSGGLFTGFRGKLS